MPESFHLIYIIIIIQDGIYGCTKEDYSNADYTGTVALIYRGLCKFEEKVILAAEAGASVVVIVNNNPEAAMTMSIGSKFNNMFKITSRASRNWLFRGRRM